MAMIFGNSYGQGVTFDFDNDYATLFPSLTGTSTSTSNDGDFTVATTSTAIDGFTVTVSAADEGVQNANRIWSGAPRLRMYSGTFTVSGKGIKSIEFTGHATNFNLSTSTGTLDGKTWTGEADEVVFNVAKNTQINKLVINGGDAPEPQVIEATCAEVIAGQDGDKFRVKGTCVEIVNTTYGNWYLEDATGKIYIYGTLDAEGKTKNFLSLGIEVGDIVTVEGPKTTYKETTVELVDVTVLKIEKPSAQGQVWDFTKWSDATIANLKADAAASKLEGWSDVEKKADAEAGADPTEASKDNCFWCVATPDANGELSANGVVIEELKGLKWNTTYSTARSLAIAVNYPSTSLGDYAGGAYLWLGGGSKSVPCFTIPAVAAGSVITIEAESHKPSDARGVELYTGLDADGKVDAATKIGDSFKPTTKDTHSWTIENAADVIVYNTSGCHIYTLKVESGSTGINTVKAAKAENNAIYNLAGQKVGSDYKGIVIKNGRKFVVK